MKRSSGPEQRRTSVDFVKYENKSKEMQQLNKSADNVSKKTTSKLWQSEMGLMKMKIELLHKRKNEDFGSFMKRSSGQQQKRKSGPRQKRRNGLQRKEKSEPQQKKKSEPQQKRKSGLQRKKKSEPQQKRKSVGLRKIGKELLLKKKSEPQQKRKSEPQQKRKSVGLRKRGKELLLKRRRNKLLLLGMVLIVTKRMKLWLSGMALTKILKGNNPATSRMRSRSRMVRILMQVRAEMRASMLVHWASCLLQDCLLTLT